MKKQLKEMLLKGQNFRFKVMLKTGRCWLPWLTSLLFSAGLGMLVRWLSDPDNLNQLVVSQLDRVTPKSSVCSSDLDLTSLASQEGDGSEA